MKNIAAIIIAKNEQDMIKESLLSVAFCDEIIIIDNDSSDDTAKIAKQQGARVFNVKTNDFSKLRNLGKEKADAKWLLYIDADERLSPKLAGEIKTIVKNPPEFSAYKLLRKNFYFGHNLWPKIEKMERLFQKDKLKMWSGELHESPHIIGNISECRNYLLHFTHRDLETMVEKTNKWSEIEAQTRFKMHHPQMTTLRFFRVILSAFYDSYIIKQGYKAKTAGIVESIFQAYSMFITYAKLWELQQKEK